MRWIQAAGRSWWLAALVLISFAACYLQFGWMGSRSPPPEARVNNGSEPTFFAVHVNPYYLFSEDFHLYVVRAKRIAARGWSDSLLFAPEQQGKNYAAPLQAAIGMIAAKTSGRPMPYAVFMSCVLSLAWLVLYVAARAALPASVSRLNILLAVLVTVLLESLQYLAHPHTEFYQWPVSRGLRMSTLAWSSPLLLAVLLCGTCLAFRRRRPVAPLLSCLGVGLVALALSDNWAFMLAWAAMGIVWLFVAGELMQRLSPIRRPRQLFVMFALGLILAGTASAFAAQTGAIRGDALARAGMGPQWQTPGTWIAPVNRELIRWYLAAIVVLVAVALVTLRLKVQGKSVQVSLSAAWNRFVRMRMQVIAIAWMPAIAMIVIVAVFSYVGTDPYHARQFQWRVDYCLLFCACLLVTEGIRRGLVRRWLAPVTARWTELAVAISCLAALWAYHEYRIHRFIVNTASREYYLTRDEEALRDWLATFSQGRGRYSLATASPELNLLCAYWTDADLWLPSGFPYHCGSSRERLEKRTADVMRLYNASAERWLTFNLHMHADDQWSWAQSRKLSASQGYMYYLLHREVWMRGYPGGANIGQYPLRAPKGSTERIAQTRALQRAAYVSAALKSVEVDEDKSVAARLLAQRAEHSPAYQWLERVGGYAAWSPRASVEAAQRIAGYIGDRDRPVPAPDVIVIDEVSQALGDPNLDDYERAFSSGSIEAWVRKAPAGLIASQPAASRPPHQADSPPVDAQRR